MFALSAQPHLRISDDDLLDLILRKSAHVLEYSVLALLASMTLRQEDGGPVGIRTLVAAACLAVAYAITDEWHQSFIPGRHAAARDVAIDAVGAVAATWVLASLQQRRTRRREPGDCVDQREPT